MSNNIRVLTDIEKIVESPGMYIGDKGTTGLFTIIREVIDNAVDEYNNYKDKTKPIIIDIHNDIVSVRDFGRGISPYESKQIEGEIEERLAFTRIGAGSKFKSERSKNGNTVSGGMHGVGATTTNVMSDFFNVTIYKDGKIFEDKFEKAHPIVDLERTKGKLHLPIIGKTDETGTLITFKPSHDLLDFVKIDTQRIRKYIQDICYLNKGLTIIYNGETYYSENGISELLHKITDNKDCLNIKGEIPMEDDDDFMSLDVVFNINEDNNRYRAFTNGIHNPQGGTHITAVTQGINRLLKNLFEEFKVTELKNYKKKIDYIEKSFKALKVNKFESLFENHYIGKYTTAIIDFRYSKPVLHHQTKDKLTSEEIIPLINKFIETTQVQLFKNNAKIITKLYALIIDDIYNNAKDLNSLVKFTKNEIKNLSKEKVSLTKSNKPEELELFLVEGDSAAGSLKINRDSNFQAILPLKGKILNVEKASIKDMFDNNEIATIFAVLFGEHLTTLRTSDNLTHHRIIIATDQDVDGKHIRILLLTLFMKLAPDIVKNGHVYLLDTPLFINEYKDRNEYTYSEDEQVEYLKTNKPLVIKRNKGLGELAHDQVIEHILNKETRRLSQVTIDNIDDIIDTINKLMGTNTSYRQDFIMNNEDDL